MFIDKMKSTQAQIIDLCSGCSTKVIFHQRINQSCEQHRLQRAEPIQICSNAPKF